MDYSSFFSNSRRNKNEKFLACWLAGTPKNFYGTGPDKLSKAQIESVNVASVCDDLRHSIDSGETVKYEKVSKLTFGALNILEKIMDFLEEKCEEVLTSLLVPAKSKKSKKKKTIPNDDWYEKEVEDNIDLTVLFRSPKDKHLLCEKDDQLPVNASCELRFDDDFSIISSGILEIREGPTALLEELYVDKRGTPKGTPKRMSETSLNETPSKRSRKDKSSVTTSVSKTAEATTTSEHVSVGRTSVASQSRARRSIFADIPQESSEVDNGDKIIQEVGIPQESSAVDGNEVMQQDPPEDLAEPLNIPNGAGMIEEPMDQSVPQEPDVFAFAQPPVPQELPTDDAVVDNIQRLTSTIQEDPENQATMALPELDDSSIVQQGKRKKNRRFVFADEEKIIDIKKNLENPNNPYVHVRHETQTRFFKKCFPVKMLLLLPSFNLKLKNWNRIESSWGSILASQFSEIVQQLPCLNVTGVMREGESPRDRGVNKRRRHTSFTAPERPTVSHTSTDSVKSIQQPVPDSYANINDEPQFQDSMLMARPPPPAFEEGQLAPEDGRTPSTPKQNKRMEQLLLRTPSSKRGYVDSSAAFSPQQSGRPSGADLEQHEPHTACESPGAAHSVMDGASIQRSRQHHLPSTPEHPSIVDEESPRLQRREYFMSKEEFGQFLEMIWTVLKNINSREELKFELKDILVPNESAREEVVVYLNYLCEFEKLQKLQITERVPYSTVLIEKLN